MFNIFRTFKLKPLDEYFKYIFDSKKDTTVSNTGRKNIGKEIKKELFNPIHKENKATSSLVVKLRAEFAACLIKEILDPTKLTSQHLSSKGGQLSWANATQQEHEASM